MADREAILSRLREELRRAEDANEVTYAAHVRGEIAHQNAPEEKPAAKADPPPPPPEPPAPPEQPKPAPAPKAAKAAG